jgi:hypothetical protein
MFRKQGNGSDRGGKSPLDKGVAINGELQVRLFNMKLLPVKVRLLISSKDLATELGLDWWRDEARRGGKSGADDAATNRPPRKLRNPSN